MQFYFPILHFSITLLIKTKICILKQYLFYRILPRHRRGIYNFGNQFKFLKIFKKHFSAKKLVMIENVDLARKSWLTPSCDTSYGQLWPILPYCHCFGKKGKKNSCAFAYFFGPSFLFTPPLRSEPILLISKLGPIIHRLKISKSVQNFLNCFTNRTYFSSLKLVVKCCILRGVLQNLRRVYKTV